MQPLGSPDLLAAYHARIAESHDYEIRADILDLSGRVVGPAVIEDGQIDLLPDSEIHRVARGTLIDPERALGLDAGSAFAGTVAANRMLRIRHTVNVPGFGDVTATPFVGPLSRLSRNGSTLDFEAQDKTVFSMYGTRPLTIGKGANAVRACRRFLADRSGETMFRFPAGNRFRLRRPYSVSWADDAAVWRRVQQIAHAAGLQALYSCDGYATLRPVSTEPVLTFGRGGIPITVLPAGDVDLTRIVNYARVEAGKVIRDAEADADHPFSPPSLGRAGVPWWRPSLIEIDGPTAPPKRPKYKSRKVSKAEWTTFSHEVEDYNAQVRSARTKAQATADAALKAGLAQEVNLSFSCSPVFHLDYADPIRVVTDDGTAQIRLTSASIPIVSGDMTIGAVKQIARPGRLRR